MCGFHAFSNGSHEILHWITLWVVWVGFNVLDPIVGGELGENVGVKWGPIISLMCFRIAKISVYF